jgi:hypothetical protein
MRRRHDQIRSLVLNDLMNDGPIFAQCRNRLYVLSWEHFLGKLSQPLFLIGARLLRQVGIRNREFAVRKSLCPVCVHKSQLGGRSTSNCLRGSASKRL